MIDTRDQAGDVTKLAELKDTDDPRTIEEMIAQDENVETLRVESVRPYEGDEDHYDVRFEEGMGIGLSGAEPKVGDTVTLYGRFGHPVYGWALNGQTVKYETPWERFATRMAMLAGFDRKRREAFARDKAKLDAKYEALPAPLKARIDRFRAERADFRVDSEAYEMAAVGDAPKIARALAKSYDWPLDENLAVTDAGPSSDAIEQAVKWFFDLPYDEQKAMVPDLDEGHSGHTFDSAVGLAFALLVGREV